MATLTDEQIAAINTGINNTQAYIDHLQDALSAAAKAGDAASGTTIEAEYEQAQLIENNFKGLLTVSDAGSLTAAVASLNVQVKNLNAHAAQIKQVVDAVGTAADIIGDITKIATSVAAIAAI